MSQVSTVVLVNKSRILMHLRDDKPGISYPDYWSIIGGGIEKNESPLQALKRECLEEIGIVPSNIRFVKRIFIPSYKVRGDDEIYVFRGDIDKEVGEINLTEGQKVEYFYFDDIQKLKMSSALKKFILENRALFF